MTLREAIFLCWAVGGVNGMESGSELAIHQVCRDSGPYMLAHLDIFSINFSVRSRSMVFLFYSLDLMSLDFHLWYNIESKH